MNKLSTDPSALKFHEAGVASQKTVPFYTSGKISSPSEKFDSFDINATFSMK